MKPSDAAFSTVFRSSFRPEVVSDVISDANVGQVDMDVPVEFVDFWLKLFTRYTALKSSVLAFSHVF